MQFGDFIELIDESGSPLDKLWAGYLLNEPMIFVEDIKQIIAGPQNTMMFLTIARCLKEHQYEQALYFLWVYEYNLNAVYAQMYFDEMHGTVTYDRLIDALTLFNANLIFSENF